MAANSPLYRMADRLAEGQLEEKVAAWRSEGFSWPDIARRLYADHAIEVSVSVLRLWFDEPRTQAAS